MPVAVQSRKPTSTSRQTVLLVEDEQDLLDLAQLSLPRQLNCRLLVARTVADARRIISTKPIDLLISDVHLPDGSGHALIQALAKHQPTASAMIITGSPSMESAVESLRQGAVDFVAKPFAMNELADRVGNALKKQSHAAKSEGRIDRLRDAVKKLNEARRTVSKKVDLLCNDLVSAYGELSRQLENVRTTESFRGVIQRSADLEQMLCHAMDWILRQMGYANVAIWLASDDGPQLGAYMKYTVAGEGPMVEAMRGGILSQIARDGLTHLNALELRKRLSKAEQPFLEGQTLLAVHCTYLGESLATLVLFRDGKKPFSAEDVATLRTIGPVFGVQLASMVRNEETDRGPGEEYNADSDIAEEDRDKPRREKKSDADWWKRGEAPPF